MSSENPEAKYGVNAIPPEQLKERIGSLQAQIDGLMNNLTADKARLAEKIDQVQQARGTGSAAEGQIEATVSAHGEVLDLQISDRAVRSLGAERLRDSVLQALREARANALSGPGAQADPKDLAVAADPIGSMLDALPDITATLPPDLVAKLRAPGRPGGVA